MKEVAPDPETMEIELALQHYLMASYLYYIKGKSLFKDTHYDSLSVRLLRDFDTFEHPHKHLITVTDLSAGTLYGVSESQYPSIVKNAAETYYKVLHG